MGMFRMIFLFGALALWLSVGTVFSAEQPSGNWTQLTKSDLSAWREPTGDWQGGGDVFVKSTSDTLFSSKPGAGVILNGSKGKTLNLISKIEHSDVEAHVEFMIPKGSNSGVYLMGRYEIQVYDSWGVKQPKYIDCGGIYERWADGKGYEGRGPRVNASRKPGEWQTFDIVFRAPRFDASGKKTANAMFVKVAHNGTVIHENVEVTGPTRAATFEDEKPTGPLMLQGDHGPVAFSNVRLRPLRPDYENALRGEVTDETYKRIARYQFGDDREDILLLEEVVRKCPPGQHNQIEAKLIETLKSPDSTKDAKISVCRILRQIGTVRCVSTLANMLTDKDLSHMARYAMQGVPDGEVDAAFRAALDNVSGNVKVGLIGSIASRGDRAAVPQLAKLLNDQDQAVAGAALMALGRIGGPEAAKALAEAKVSDALKQTRADAYLLCADKMAAEGKAAQALAIYREMLSEGNTIPIRIASIQGIVRVGDDPAARAAIPSLIQAAESNSRAVSEAAQRALKTLRAKKD